MSGWRVAPTVPGRFLPGQTETSGIQRGGVANR